VKHALCALAVAIVACGGAVATAQTGPIVRFVGVVNPDGCSGCCEFDCQLTPTPTPQTDAQGRPVFVRSSGSSFLLVAEAGPGTSGRQPGSEGVYSAGAIQPIVDPSGRPSIQLIPSRDLGNGSTQVDCRGIKIGGVKGFPNGLTMPAGSDITTGLIDMACRFELVSTAAACTRDRFGNFAFLNPVTTRQFCYQLSAAAELPIGDTIFSLQFRDTSGNLGPRKEIVVRVNPSLNPPPFTSTPTRTPTPTATPVQASVGGRIRYYSADRPVPGATVQITGVASLALTTSTTGTYQSPNMVSGNVLLEPKKTGASTSGAISALDASWVLQAVAGTRTFDANQRLACDVTGNGTLSALDATRILQRLVGLPVTFGAADQCGSDWLFKPNPGPSANQRLIQPLLSTGTCRHGGIALEPMVGGVSQQDFLGLLIGDCTGNWQPPASGAAFAATAPGPHTLRVRSARPASGEGGLRLPLAVKGDDPYYSLDITIAYDLEHLAPLEVRKLRAAGDALIVSNLAGPGLVRIAVASAYTMPSGISIIAVDFDGSGTAADLHVVRAMVDDLPAPVVD
jgi:hypothetical protein